jgi:deoxyribodipyrimidine photo-lyase
LTQPVVVWFRDDLRLSDHAALHAAAATGRPLICLYLLDEESEGLRPLGGAARWWLAQSLRALSARLEALGLRLVLRRGRAAQVLPQIASETGASTVYWNRRIAGPTVDAETEAALRRAGVSVETFPANLLFEPQADAQMPRVFTAFWRRMLASAPPREPMRAPSKLGPSVDISGDDLSDWALEPTKPDWAGGLREAWTAGEVAAQDRLATFLDETLKGYATQRDRVDSATTSRLSPHLRFGEISAVQVWHAAQHARDRGRGLSQDVDKFLAELGWREFCYRLLHHNPDLATRNLQANFDKFPWRKDEAGLRAWQRGRTGYPIVDAAMRDLWQTGTMPNRLRMVVASFLSKHLLIDWREGEAWFWDTLVDADPASNPANWQWVAGSGMDAAPYFRIFNPVLQGEKFDPGGAYVRRFVPELADVPRAQIHKPGHGGRNGYPPPIVDHGEARKRALAAFDRIRKR